MEKKIVFAAALLLSGAFVSCNNGALAGLGGSGNGNRNIRVNVSGISSHVTKSAGQDFIGSYDLTDADGSGFVIDVYAAENLASPFEAEPDTKASIVTTGGINVSGQKFIMNAWLGSQYRYPNDLVLPTYEQGGSTGRVNFAGDENKYRFIDNSSVTYDGSVWSLLDGQGKEYLWRNNVPTVFWSAYPEFASSNDVRTMHWPADKADDADQKVFTFDYSNLPANTQQDLLFAYNYQRASFGSTSGTDDYGKLIDGTTDEVSILFRHALAAVRFDVSSLLAKNYTIKNVSFSGLAADGVCTVSGTGANGIDFSWDRSGTKTTGCTMALKASDFTEKSLDGTTDNALMARTSDKFLFLMPQEISGKGVVLEIVFETPDALVVTKSVELDHVAWEAGLIYTYKLSPAEVVVDVLVEDVCEGDTKSDVTITNTGDVPAFVRVAVIGNWYVKNSTVLSRPWKYKPSDTAYGIYEGINTTDWTYNETDGYFYSNAPMAVDAVKTLFDQFTAPAGPEGGELRIDIIAQAVAAGNAASWAEAVQPLNN